LKGGSTVGIPSPPAIWLPSGEVVTPDVRDAERLQGLRADWTKPAETVARRGSRWKLIGNAVTVDVAAWIGQRLRKPGNYDDALDRRISNGGAWPKAAWNLGDGRFASQATAWPVRRAPRGLSEFLRYPTKPLSLKATSGFIARTRKSSLHFPAGFLDALGRHAERSRMATREIERSADPAK